MSSNDNDELTDKTTVLQAASATLQNDLNKAKEQDACLIIIRGQPQGHRFFINQPKMVIGRDPSADISLVDQAISRKHSELSKEGDRIRLTDLKSSNGTFVNNKRIPSGGSVLLTKEDMITIGSWILKFLPAGELEILVYGNLNQAANTDPMTKAYNKGYLMEALDAEFKRAKALHTDFSVVFCDLDHFKKLNDTYGHDAGDFVLKKFVLLVQSGFLRPKDIFARYGGEEFVILLAGMNAKKAAEVAEKIRGAIETHAFIYEGKRLPVTSSVGVSELRSDIESAQTLLRAADKALYEAKSGGRNRVVIAT